MCNSDEPARLARKGGAIGGCDDGDVSHGGLASFLPAHILRSLKFAEIRSLLSPREDIPGTCS